MAQSPHQSGMILLGATGKVGRSIRAVWPGVAPDVPLFPVSRRSDPTGLTVWQPGDPAPQLGPIRAVLAAWGVTRGHADALAQNAQLARAALDLALEIGAPCVLHCSSAAIYAPGPDPLTEASTLDPPGAYGAAKCEMERAIEVWHADHGPTPRSIVLRIGNYAGCESLFGNLRPGGAITLDRFSDEKGPRRSYIAPTDFAHVLLRLLDAPEASGVYNVAAPVPVEMEAIARAAGATVHWKEAPTRAVQHLCLNTARLNAVIALPKATADPAYLVANARASGVWP